MHAGRLLNLIPSRVFCFDISSCSILYKTKLPFILVFNKTDVEPHDFALEWMQDFEAFQAALASHHGTTDEDGEPTYMNSLMNSMSLVLDEFYKHLKAGHDRSSFYIRCFNLTSVLIGCRSLQYDGCGREGILRCC